MRALRPMTPKEREFAEQYHDLVLNFLHYRHLPMNDFYDIVIFGYLSAVQQYFRNPPPDVTFKAMAFRMMLATLLQTPNRRPNVRLREKSFWNRLQV